jgi:predicted O-linked N-acetylglucosamine transferase (SPINDLY family)
LGIALQHHQAGRLPEAESVYRQILLADSHNVDALHFLGVIAYQRAEHKKAEELISRALQLKDSNAPAHNNLGNALAAQGKLKQAVASFLSALALDPHYVDALVNLGSAFRAQGEPDKAIECYERALSLAPGSTTATAGLRGAIEDKRTLGDVAGGEKALSVADAESPSAHLSAGNAYKDEGRLEEAVASYQKALSINPDFSPAYVNLGNVLQVQGKSTEAVNCYRKALAANPDLPEAHFNLANVFRDQNKLDQAATHYEKTIALQPESPDAHFALGHVFRHQGRLRESLDCYRKALSLDPGNVEARWALALSQVPKIFEMGIEPSQCRAAFSANLDELDRWFDETRVAEGDRAVGSQQPFTLAYQEEDNRDLLERYGRLCTRLMGAWFERQGLVLPERRRSEGAIRVGFVSQYFWNHSVWNAIVKGWFQMLNRERFAICAFYLGTRQDEETLIARSCSAHFEQGGRDLQHWVRAIVDQRPDVLIYPEIGMDPMTLKLASLRLAPVQVATWGHPETTGLPTIDYYLSAEDLEPDKAQEHYSERLVELPHLGCFYEPLNGEPLAPDLASMGIDAGSPFLLCPGMPFKYAPQFDWVLAEIASRLGRCQLVFFVPDAENLAEILQRRLESAFARRGLRFRDFGVFVPWQSGPAFDGLLSRAAVFLDTIGFSGFNTAMQAVEAGIPIVTREGRFMRGRLASGILKRMGLEELVAGSEQDYVQLAVRLIQDHRYRERVRRLIESKRSVLFGDMAPIRGLEAFLFKVAG